MLKLESGLWDFKQAKAGMNMPETAKQVSELTALLSKDPNPIFKHKKTGKKYVYLLDALVEHTGQAAIIYKSCDTGQRFVRPASEFFDGRFEFVA